MIATISFGSIVNWIGCTFAAGFGAGVAFSVWFVKRKRNKEAKKETT